MEKNTGKLFTPVHGTPMDYLRWRGDLTFRQDGFNEVDNLVLCIISYINFRRITAVHTTEPSAAPTLAQVAPLLTEEDDQLGLSELSYLPLVQLAAKTPRFRGVRLFAYTHEYDEAQAKQFDALSFLLPDGTLFVAFMGTDTSLAGWKEDFNMSFLSAVPAQARAAAYAADMAALCPDMPLRIGGHSKGGNLAAWAAIHLPADLQEHRLLSAYNNDGPGFARDMLETPEYLRVADKLHTYIPESSIVGVLLEWIGSMTPAEREQFTDALFDVLSLSGKARTLDDLRSGGLAGGAALLKQYAGADEQKKKIISEIFRRLAVDVKSELKRAAGEGLEGVKKAAGEGLEAAKNAITSLTRGEK